MSSYKWSRVTFKAFFIAAPIIMLAACLGFFAVRSCSSPRLWPFKYHHVSLLRRNTSASFPSPWPLLAPNESLTFTLRDGRTLGFSNYGPQHGYPILICHGLPGSRIDARGLKTLDPGFGLRMIGIDRPGIGLSSPNPSRTLTDWPFDVDSLIRHLGLKEFKVLGGSGGGPFALACTHAHSHGLLDGLAGTGVLCGLGPMEAGLQGMRLRQRLAWKIIPHLPSSYIRSVNQWYIGRHAINTSPIPFERAIHRYILKYLKAEEKEIMLRPDVWRDFVESMREAFIQGADGYANDARLLGGPWGFRLEDVESKVCLWWGTADDLAPLAMGRWMAAKLRYGRLREFKGETHWTLIERHAEEIFSDLLEM